MSNCFFIPFDVGEESQILKAFSSYREKLILSFKFEQHWLANQLFDKGLIDSAVKDDVLNYKNSFSSRVKAEMIYGSVLDQINTNERDNIATLKVILKKKKVYKDAVSLLCKN